MLDEPTEEGISNHWDELLRTKEEELARSWLERRLLPLKAALPDAEVRKRRACLRAAEIAEARRGRPAGESADTSGRFEQWVQTPDGKVGGLVDCVYRRQGRLVLRDYKSGSIQGSTDGTVKEEYALQVRLYAALYALTFHEWPDELELVALEGSATSVPFERSECEELRVRAASLLEATNARIRAVGDTPVDEASQVFARPGSETCRFCQYRPMCSKYRLERSVRSAEAWPPDAWGVVRELRVLGNGSGLLVLDDAGASGVQIRLRGIEPDLDRHPALRWLLAGGFGVVFNMRRTAYPGSYVQQSSTILYADSAVL